MSNIRKPPGPRRKTIYHVRNWSEYDRALVQRGSLTFWVDEAVRRQWNYAGPPQRGAQFTCSEVAIEARWTLKELFHLSNRATAGRARSLFVVLKVSRAAPDHTPLSRRGKTLRVRLPKQARGALPRVLDRRGLKVYGAGEWKVRPHGGSQRRTWRKVQLSVDAESREIQAARLAQVDQPIAHVAADGAYDRTNVYQALAAQAPEATIAIPPRRGARIGQHGNRHAPPLVRDENLRALRRQGRARCKRESGYHRRSLAETAVFRLKRISGDHLSARRLDTRATQPGIRCRMLNRMTHLRMPQSYKVA